MQEKLENDLGHAFVLCNTFLSHMQIKLNIHVLSYRDPYLHLAGGRQKTLVVL